MRNALEKVKHHFIPSRKNAYRPHLLGRSWLLFFFVVTLATEGFLVASLVARQSQQSFLAAVVPGEIIALTNDERQQYKVPGLKENAQLDAAAQAKAEDMAAKGYFSHTSPGGKLPWDWIAQAGYDYQFAGENLAVRFVDSKDVLNAWMASAPHRANIVKAAYTDIGVGVADGMYQGQPATYVVQYFGSPMPSSVPAAVGAAPQPGSFFQSLERQVLRFASEPRSSAGLILGLVAALLILVVALTFFIHIEIQPAHMLAGGALIALFAISLLAANARLLAPDSSQAASVVVATDGAQ